MEICRYAEPVKTADHSCIYYCGLYGYEMGLDLGHWCEGCNEYTTELSGDGHRVKHRRQVPCAVCRFNSTCRFKRQSQRTCPYFSQK